MGVWGKFIGGAAGFALGGPLGALVGAVAGHAIDRLRKDRVPAEEAKPLAFTVAVVVLAAKMAKADGVVTRDEIAAFKRIFRVPPGEMASVGRLFDEARRDAMGFEPYAQQIAAMFKDSPRVLEELLDALFEIAKADNTLHPAELAYLRAVASAFGFDAAAFERVRAGHVAAAKADPHGLLGVSPKATGAEIKAAYRRLVREHHPDLLIAQGMPQELIDLANDKLAAINGAYETIRRRHRPK